MWNWKNEQAIRHCDPESFAAYDFNVFDYTVDVKTSRDVSAFQPAKLLDNDPDDDILVMVWHRDNEDALIMLGWERTETLKSKVRTQEAYSGEEPEKLAHLATRPMNELHDLGPNTAHLNQKPENPFQPGDRVEKASHDESSVGVVVEVLPPEENATLYGQELEGEAVHVAFPSTLDEGPGDWRTIHPAKLTSYCVDQDIHLYDYKHTNLEYADQPFTVGDYVIKPDYDNPDLAVVTKVSGGEVTIVFEHLLKKDYLQPQRLEDVCEKHDIDRYSFDATEMAFEPQY